MNTIKNRSCCAIRSALLLLCSLGLSSSLWAQDVPPEACGTVMDDKAYAQYRQQVQQQQKNHNSTGEFITLKLQPHIIRRSNGTGGFGAADLNLSIQQLNNAFAQVGMYFDACTPNYINNDAFYNEIVLSDDPNSLEYQMAIPNRVDDAVNVFFVPNGVGDTGAALKINWSSFPYQEQTENKNWTVMSIDFSTDGETLAHEIGHYLNLLHTHFYSAIEGQYDGQNILRESVTRNPADPCYNCETAGDLICDTPADPYLFQKIDVNCQYTAAERDNCGNLPYQPDNRNVMSYSLVDRNWSGCRTNFTAGQNARMRAALSQYRTGLASSCSGCPTNRTVTQNVFNGQVDIATASNRVTATNTIFNGGRAVYSAGTEVVLAPGFEVVAGGEFAAFIDDCSAAAPPAAKPSGDPMAAVSAASTIRLSLAPNPAHEQVAITFSLPEERAFAHIRLVNAQGQAVKQTAAQEALTQGEYQVAIRTDDLPAGLYFVQLLTEQETLVRQLVVVQ